MTTQAESGAPRSPQRLSPRCRPSFPLRRPQTITGPFPSIRPELPPDQQALASISQKLWSNLGYCAPAGRVGTELLSTAMADFVYDTEEGIGFDGTKARLPWSLTLGGREAFAGPPPRGISLLRPLQLLCFRRGRPLT